MPGSVEMPGRSGFSFGSKSGSAPAFWPGVSFGHSTPSSSSGSPGWGGVASAAGVSGAGVAAGVACEEAGTGVSGAEARGVGGGTTIGGSLGVPSRSRSNGRCGGSGARIGSPSWAQIAVVESSRASAGMASTRGRRARLIARPGAHARRAGERGGDHETSKAFRDKALAQPATIRHGERIAAAAACRKHAVLSIFRRCMAGLRRDVAGFCRILRWVQPGCGDCAARRSLASF